MSGITAKLLAQIQKLDLTLELPTVQQVILPQIMLSDSEVDAKYDKFGMVVLADNSCGLFYRLLGMETERINHYRELAQNISGKSVMETASLFQA